MKQTDENVAWATERLTKLFGSRKGHPESDEEKELHGKLYLRLVHGKRVSDIIGKPHSKLGDPVDYEWLESEVALRSNFYPSPQELRDLYVAYLPPYSEY
jgi:hypothetical protein